MSLKYNEEFKYALKDIGNNSFKLESQFGIVLHFIFQKPSYNIDTNDTVHYYLKNVDRVRCTEWLHKLVMLPDDSLENIKIRNEYAQYLRIMIRAGVLHGLFAESPPNILLPFPEAIVS